MRVQCVPAPRGVMRSALITLSRGVRMRMRLVLLFLFVGAILAPPSAAATACLAPAPVRVMPVGDSLTVGQTDEASAPWNPPLWNGYRAPLWTLLTGDGYAINFVGSQQNGDSQLPDRDHEGHGAWSVAQVRDGIGSWVQMYQPDVILLQIGTPDMLSYPGQDALTAAYWQLLVNIHEANPATWVLASTIPPADGTLYGQPGAGNRAILFNDTLPGIVQAARLNGHRAKLVNVGGSLSPSVLYDGIHPRKPGYDAAAAGWHAAVRAIAPPPWCVPQTPPAAPTMTAASGNPPAFTWTAPDQYVTGWALYDWGPGGTTYDLVEVYRAASVCSGAACSVVVPTSLAAGQHGVWVIGWNEMGWGQWSEAYLYTIN